MSGLQNKINKDCKIHMKVCKLFCSSGKCAQKILCQKCVIEHLQVHPRQFICDFESLSDIHSFNKIDKMKEILVTHKLANEHKIKTMYAPFKILLGPLIDRVKQFEKESSEMIKLELTECLAKNKSIIESAKITKHNTNEIKKAPQIMLEETIEEYLLVNQKQKILKQNTQNYTWYSDATEQLCSSAVNQISSMISVAVTLLNNYTKIQRSKFTETHNMDNHHQVSFYKRYVNSHEVASRGEKNALEMNIIQSKKQIQRKDQEIKRADAEIRDKLIKINEQENIIKGLKEQLVVWEKKKQREETERREAIEREHKKKEEYLIKNDIIIDDWKTITMEKKNIEEKYFHILLDLVPNPVMLILTSHNLTNQQLSMFYKCTSLQILKMSFVSCNTAFLTDALRIYQNLHTLQLNSASINDDTIIEISANFSPRLRHLYLIDNQISDKGLELMFRNMVNPLDSLYVSYNQLSSSVIEIISKHSFQIKILHISKNSIRKGGSSIGKFMKELEELFIGSTGIQKEGFLSIIRNCKKLKRLSLVANDLSTDIVSEIMLGLEKLQWLDVSYTGLSESDLEKIEKFKIFNKNLEIVSHL